MSFESKEYFCQCKEVRRWPSYNLCDWSMDCPILEASSFQAEVLVVKHIYSNHVLQDRQVCLPAHDKCTCPTRDTFCSQWSMTITAFLCLPQAVMIVPRLSHTTNTSTVPYSGKFRPFHQQISGKILTGKNITD